MTTSIPSAVPSHSREWLHIRWTPPRIIAFWTTLLTLALILIFSARTFWNIAHAEYSARLLRSRKISLGHNADGPLYRYPVWLTRYFKPAFFANVIGDLSGAFTTETGLSILNDFPELNWLHLRSYPLNDQLVSLLRRHPDFRALQLMNSQATDDQLRAVSSLSKLRVLVLKNSHLTDDGLAGLAAFLELEDLWLESDRFDGKGFAHLCKLPQLKRLIFYGKEFDDRMLDALTTALADHPLESLSFYRTSITEQGSEYIDRITSLKEHNLNLPQNPPQPN